jgi:hypothetical protein
VWRVRRRFDSQSEQIPFLLRYREAGPPAVEIVGEYDPASQTWVHPAPAPALITTRSTSRSTTRSTTRTTTRTTFRARMSDTQHDSQSDTNPDHHPDTTTD